MIAPGQQCPEPGELMLMARSLRHRGPDGFGVYFDDHVGLSHVRLAIVDREGGAQPLSNQSGTLWITFNGEVFNYLELRDQLVGLGHVFRTRSDTEVAIHAFEQWGDGAWSRLNGQFAIALWDTRQRRLHLVRDRVGISPLYYARSADSLVFGSEAKAIFAAGRVSARPDLASVAAVFSMWAAPGPETVFAGVRSVPPGVAICFDQDLAERQVAYHTLHFETEPDPPKSAEEAADALHDRLERAVRIRFRADVPVGAYLSGGLDSSVITRLVRRADSAPLQTFSVRFSDSRFDEGPAQQEMARLLGTTHHEIVATPGMIRDALPNVIHHCETPLLRSAPVPMFVLSSLVRELGMRVVLTGEGADEFLGGYDIFKEDKIRRFWARRPESHSRPSLLGRVHPYVANAQGAMWQEFFRRGLTDVEHPFYSHRLRWENTAWTLRFLSPEVRGSLGKGAIQDRLEALLPSEWAQAPTMSRAQHLEIATFMTPYLLASQGDRALMSHGVEGRYPYLDPEVISFCSGLPSHLKLCGLRDKVVLRTLAARLLPREVAQRRKWPFRAPIVGALFGAQAPEYVRELLSPKSLGESSLIDARAASGLVARTWSGQEHTGEREEMALMGLLTLQLWFRAFLAKRDTHAERICERDLMGSPSVWADRRTKARESGRAA